MFAELLKVLKKIYVQITIIIVLLITVWWGTTAIYKVSYTDENGNTILQGAEAAYKIIEDYEGIKFLTPQVLNQTLNYYKKCCDDANNKDNESRYYRAEFKTDKRYPGVLRIISRVYFPDDYGINYEGIYGLQQADDFYSVWESNYLKKITIKEEKKDLLKNTIRNIKYPFEYGYHSRWRLYDDAMSMLFSLLAIATIFVCADFFSSEKKHYMDAILIAIGEKNYRRLINHKLLASLFFTSVAFFICDAINTIGFWMKIGMPATNCPIQIVYPLSILHITIGGRVLLFTLLGWMSILSLGLLAFTLNLYGCSSIKTILISGTIYFLPGLLVAMNVTNQISNEFLRFFIINQPIMNCIPKECIQSLDVTCFGSVVIPTAYSTMGINFIYIILFLILIYIKVKRNMRKAF